MSITASSTVICQRPFHLSVALILGTILAGLAIRFAPLGLPAAVVKFGGSGLWALMLYWFCSTILTLSRLSTVALLTGLLATAVELFKLFHTPRLDLFRLTLPGVLLFGRFFSIWDIAVYWAAIVAGCLIDQRIRQEVANA